MRVAVGALLRLWYRYASQHLHGHPHRLALAHALVHGDRLADLATDREERIERGHRLLEDHGDVVAADALHSALIDFEQVPALEADCPADDTARRIGNQSE